MGQVADSSSLNMEKVQSVLNKYGLQFIAGTFRLDAVHS